MATATDRQPTVEAFPLNAGGSVYSAEIDRVCRENELVISVWSPIHLRTKLRDLYWKADKPAVGAMVVWEDMQRYLYLPRLLDREVLGQAILKGAGSRDFFATAYGQTADAYDGFKFGDSSVQLDDTLLLIDPDAATKYETTLAKNAATTAAAQVAAASTATGSSGVGEGAQLPLQPSAGVQPAIKARAFYGAVDVRASSAKVRLVQIADEIVNVLASDPNATIKITVEISAEYTDGASDQIKRAVAENATSLGFKNKTWE